MSTLAVFGASGYAGVNIVGEALLRGHTVIGFGRTAGSVTGVDLRIGSITDPDVVESVSRIADVVVVAVPAGTLLAALPDLMARTVAAGKRLAVVGGAGGLLVSADGPRFIDTPEFQDLWKLEAEPHVQALEMLRHAPPELDWFYLSPAAKFGKWSPGERTGVYRITDDLLLTDSSGSSNISGADYAIAFVNEIEVPEHSRRRFAVAY